MDPSVFVDDLRDICEENVKQLSEIWQGIGYSQRKIDDNIQIVKKNVAELLKEMVGEEKENQAKLLSDIENKLEEANLLSKEVGADYQALTAGLEDKSIPLISVAEILEDRIKEVRRKKEVLLADYSELLKKEERICYSMGLHKQPKILGVPSQKALDKFSVYLQQKEEEEKNLRQRYEELKEKIEVIRCELQMEPDTSFHKHLASGSMCLSPENMMMLASLYESMVQRLELAKEKSVELREKLTNLWDRLNVPHEDRNAVLCKCPGYSMKAIDALKAEIKRCEDQKRQNIRVFVDTIRKEIEDWWNKCCFGEQQRRTFHAFYSDCYTEDLLDLHELEAGRLRNYFENNRHILDLTQKWNEQWDKMIELDIKAHDPKRLFGNRGGQLLREEKERKTLQKQLPHIEEELTKYVDEYEKNQNSPFLYKGLKLKDFINEKWEEWHKQKESEKLARKRGRDPSEDRKTGMGKSMSSTKRKIVRSNTPVPVPSKISKLTPAATTGTRPNVVRRLLTRKGNNTPAAPQKNVTRMHDTGIGSQDPSYVEFQEGIEKKSAAEQMARSTEFPVRCLRDRNVIEEPRPAETKHPKPPRTPKTPRTPRIPISGFRTPQPSRALSAERSYGAATTSRLTTTRGRLPIII